MHFSFCQNGTYVWSSGKLSQRLGPAVYRATGDHGCTTIISVYLRCDVELNPELTEIVPHRLDLVTRLSPHVTISTQQHDVHSLDAANRQCQHTPTQILYNIFATTSCARGDTICRHTSPLPVGAPAPRAPPSRPNVAVLSHAEYVPTLPMQPPYALRPRQVKRPGD